MKLKIILILFFHGLCFPIFSQHYFMETLDDILIGPENVDAQFEEQVGLYLELYNSMSEYMKELQSNQQKEIERLEGKVKTKMLRLGEIKRAKEKLELLELENEILEEYILLWAQYDFENAMEDFGKKYDSKKCFSISSIHFNLDPFEYLVKKDEREILKWKEFIPNDLKSSRKISKSENNKLIRSRGKKWIKRRNDKNCLSNDPNDCLVWCLVEIPAEYQTSNYSEIIPKDFQLSEERNYFFRENEILKSDNRKYRIIDLRTETEVEIKNFKEVSCN